MKKATTTLILLTIFTLTIIFTTTITATATEQTNTYRQMTANEVPQEQLDAAEKLYKLGLFEQITENKDGTPNFALNYYTTRIQAYTILIRAIGEEQNARNNQNPTTFQDLTAKQHPIISHAMDSNMVHGITKTRFNPDDQIRADHFLTAVLATLEYDCKTDLRWCQSWTKTDRLNITDKQFNEENNAVSRGEMTIIILNTLTTNLKNSEYTLIEKMIENGIFENLHEQNKINSGKLITAVETQDKEIIKEAVMAIINGTDCDYRHCCCPICCDCGSLFYDKTQNHSQEPIFKKATENNDKNNTQTNQNDQNNQENTPTNNENPQGNNQNNNKPQENNQPENENNTDNNENTPDKESNPDNNNTPDNTNVCDCDNSTSKCDCNHNNDSNACKCNTDSNTCDCNRDNETNDCGIENPCDNPNCEICNPKDTCDGTTDCNNPDCDKCNPSDGCNDENPCDNPDCEDCGDDSGTSKPSFVLTFNPSSLTITDDNLIATAQVRPDEAIRQSLGFSFFDEVLQVINNGSGINLDTGIITIRLRRPTAGEQPINETFMVRVSVVLESGERIIADLPLHVNLTPLSEGGGTDNPCNDPDCPTCNPTDECDGTTDCNNPECETCNPSDDCGTDNPCNDPDCPTCNPTDECDGTTDCGNPECETCNPSDDCDTDNPCTDPDCPICNPTDECDGKSDCGSIDCDNCNTNNGCDNCNCGDPFCPVCADFDKCYFCFASDRCNLCRACNVCDPCKHCSDCDKRVFHNFEQYHPLYGTWFVSSEEIGDGWDDILNWLTDDRNSVVCYGDLCFSCAGGQGTKITPIIGDWHEWTYSNGFSVCKRNMLCSHCNDIFYDEARVHDYGAWSDWQHTANDTHSRVRTCNVCGHSDTDVCSNADCDKHDANAHNIIITSSFTDPNFLAEVRAVTGIEYGDIYLSDVSEIMVLDVQTPGIADFAGIEHFENLLRFTYMFGEYATEKLDVSRNHKLVSIFMLRTKIKSIDLSSLTNLNTFSFNFCELESIDISNNPNLQTLNITNNNITSLDITNNPMLRNISADHNNLETIYIGDDSNLRSLSIRFNNFTQLDLSNCNNLETLYTERNRFPNRDAIILAPGIDWNQPNFVFGSQQL